MSSFTPEDFDNFIGQEEAKTVVSTLLKASEIEDKAIPHIAFSGLAGTGKTSLSKICASKIGSNLYTINCSTIDKFDHIKVILNRIQRKDILFLDEIHSLKKKVSESLYTVMENFCLYDKHGYKINIPEFTVIGATTDFGMLPEPLRMRFKFTAVFKEYSIEELTKICHLVCKSKKFTLTEKLARVIANTCRNTPRNVVSRTEWIYAYMIANNLKKISKDQVLDVINLQGFNSDGLESRDLDYLRALKDNPLSLKQIGFKVNSSSYDIEHIIEPYLIKLGLVEITTSGRNLTQKGYNYVRNI